jgi:phospholipase C
LLIWTYDEHGGSYDHVPPPEAEPPDDVPGRDLVLSWPSCLPALTRRDAAAASPLDALDLDGPPAFLTPPDLPAPSRAWHAR